MTSSKTKMALTTVFDVVPDNDGKIDPFQKLPGKYGVCVSDSGALKFPGYAVIGDAHIGPRRSLGVHGEAHDKALFRALESALTACYGAKIRVVIFAGDVFDAVSVAPRYVSRVNTIINRFAYNGMSIIAMSGNHDTRRNESALWYLDKCVTRVMFPRVIRMHEAANSLPAPRIAFAPFVPGRDARSVLDETLSLVELSNEEREGEPNVSALIMHYGMYGDRETGWICHDPSFIPAKEVIASCVEVGVSVVIAGHRHGWFVEEIDGGSAVCVGSVAPRSSAETGYGFGNVAVVGNLLETPSIDLFTGVAPGPRYLTEADINKSGTRGCWALLTERPEDVHIEVGDPEDAYDTIDKVTSVAKTESEAPPRCVITATESAEKAIVEYVLDDVRIKDKPVFGVLRHALAHLSGAEFELGLSTPPVLRRLSGLGE